ncbi:ion transporter [Melissospora conviva]|uniref:ion transporter n=1 Tax=Melissospora conviva TaxID=3388432 RepID=UPI003B825ED2
MTINTREPLHRVTETCAALVREQWFSIAGFVVIVVNAAALGLETYGGVTARYGLLLRAIEYVCLAALAVELLIRFGAELPHPSRFFRDGWNLFDLAIVLAPLLPGVQEQVTMLRMLRLARTARAFRLFPSLRVILTGIRHSLPGLGSFLVITVLVLYVYAMLGWMLFGQAYPERYGTVGQAMLTLGLLLSLDGITDTLQTGREVSEWAIAYYLSYMICACYLLTNLLVGVVLNALQEAHEHERRALAARNGPPVDPAAPGSAQAPAGPAVRAVPAPPEAVADRAGGTASDEPAIREQLAVLRTIIADLERRMPEQPVGVLQPAPHRVGAGHDAAAAAEPRRRRPRSARRNR